MSIGRVQSPQARSPGTGPELRRRWVNGSATPNLESMFQRSQVVRHLLACLAAHDKGNEDLADAVPFEVDRDSQLGARGDGDRGIQRSSVKRCA